MLVLLLPLRAPTAWILVEHTLALAATARSTLLLHHLDELLTPVALARGHLLDELAKVFATIPATG